MEMARQALFRALGKGDVNMLRAVLAQGVKTDYVAGDPGPVFLMALSRDFDDLDMLELLRDAGADVHAVSREDGRGAVHWSLGRLRPDVLDWFLDRGVDVNRAASDGTTPLMAAIGLAGRAAAARRDIDRLLRAGAEVGVTDMDGRGALHLAAAGGLAEVVGRLLDGGAAIDGRDAGGATPLLHAVEGGQAECVARLLAAGAQVNAQAAGGFGALHDLAATEAGEMTAVRLEIARALIAAGIDVEMADRHGRTALGWAAAYDNVEVAGLLLRHGARTDADGGYALREAALNGRAGLVRLLLEAGAAMDLAEAGSGNLALHLAAQAGEAEVVAMLLAAGAEVEAENGDGETALVVAARHGTAQVVGRLLRHGADAGHFDHYGNTALSVASRRRDEALISLLHGGPADSAGD